MTKTLVFLTAILLAPLAALHAAELPLNVLLITADDLGYEAMDFLDGKVPGVTPNLSKLAAEGLSFEHGFVINAPIQARVDMFRLRVPQEYVRRVWANGGPSTTGWQKIEVGLGDGE